jgi:hypothetical protein
MGEPAGLNGRVVEVLNPDPVMILATSPYHGQIVWEAPEAIFVTFSSPMNTTSVQWSIWPETVDFDLHWSQNDTLLALVPVEYLHWAYTYTVTIYNAEDKEGNGLGPGVVPNPWSFYLDPCPTHIAYTWPPDGAIDVPLQAPIWVLFSVCMDPYSLNWTIDPFIELTPEWENYYMDLTFEHESPFEGCTEYTIEVDAIDYGGRGLDPGPVPNPWSFTTQCTPAQLLTDITSGMAVPLSDDMFRTDFSDEPLVEIGPPGDGGDGTVDIDNARDETQEDEMVVGAVLEAYSGPSFRDSSRQDLSGGNPATPVDDDFFCACEPPVQLWLVQIGAASLCLLLFLFSAQQRRRRPA